MSEYPASFDKFQPSGDPLITELQNAVVAMQTELGLNPKGNYMTVSAELGNKLDKTGDNLRGDVTANPGVEVDGVDISEHSHTGTAGDAPKIGISSVTNLQSTLDGKAPLASPALTGTPTAPTAANGTNTTQLATTQFVNTAIAGGVEYVRLNNSTDLPLLNGVDTTLTWDTNTAISTGSLHSTSSNTSRIVFPTTGFRVVGCNLEYEAQNGGNRRQAYIILNGTTAIAIQYQSPVQGSLPTAFTISTGYYFTANDYIEVKAYQDSGSTVEIAASSSTPYGAVFWSYK